MQESKPAPARKRSPLEEAAIVLLALPETEAAAILSALPREASVRLARAMMRLGTVATDEAEAVLTAFNASVTSKGALADERRQRDLAARLLRVALNDQAAGAGARLDHEAASSDLRDLLARHSPAVIAAAVAQEAIQGQAVVLAHLRADQAALVLGLFAPARQVELLLRLARLGPVNDAALAAMTEALREQLAKASAARTDLGGPDKVANLLNTLDPATAAAMLARLERASPALAAEVKARMFTFGDLTRLDDLSFQRLYREFKPEQWALALRGADPKLREKALRNLSPRTAAALAEELDGGPKVRASDAEAARQAIAAKARTLLADGALTLESQLVKAG